MGRLAVVAVMVGLVAMSGCAATAPEGQDGDHATRPDGAGGDDQGLVYDWDAGIPAPVWAVGDWWQYDVSYATGETFTAKIIFHKEEGGAYHLTADNVDLVFRAAFPHYPNLAPVGAEDLAQTIHGATVRDFQFPMKNATWSGTYRDLGATWNSSFAMLPTGKGEVPGFRTAMTADHDGGVRIRQGWSPVTKWYTEFMFDFAGTDTPDVVYTLKDWGTNHTGTFPIVTISDGVHRAFPVVGLAPPAGAPQPPGPSATDTFVVAAAGSTVLHGMFAVAGGAGDFEFTLTPPGAAPYNLPYRPDGPAEHFEYGTLEDAPAGEWQVFGSGAAQDFAFLFLETFVATVTEGTLPATG